MMCILGTFSLWSVCEHRCTLPIALPARSLSGQRLQGPDDRRYRCLLWKRQISPSGLATADTLGNGVVTHDGSFKMLAVR
jgi:hypothetical protein